MAKGRTPSTPYKAPPGHRWCTRCNTFRPLTDFSKNDSYCRTCRRDYMREYRAKKAKLAEVIRAEAVLRCTCDNKFAVDASEGALETGVWTCPSCGKLWNGRIRVVFKEVEDTP